MPRFIDLSTFAKVEQVQRADRTWRTKERPRAPDARGQFGTLPVLIKQPRSACRGSQLTTSYADILAGGLVNAMINTATATTAEPTMKGM